jgi:replicative DNA helicase
VTDDADLSLIDRDLAAELTTLVCLMRSRGKAADDITITGDEFGDRRLGSVFDRAVNLYRRDGFVDFVSIGESLVADPIRGFAAHELIAAERDAPHGDAAYYAAIVHRWAVKRELRMAGQWVANTAYAAEDLDALADQARARIDKACGATVTDVVTLGESIYETIADLEREDVVTPTPWPDLDHLIGGLRPGAMYVIGARPGSGKSIVGSMLALDMARRGKWASFSSLEMSRNELNRRWLAQSGRVDLGVLENHRDRIPWDAVNEVSGKLARLPIAVDERCQTTWDVRHHARSVARKGPLGVVVVDYLQLMKSPRSNDRRSRQEQVSDMSREMKLLAREMQAPVVVLCQLNRESEARTDGMPRMSDLRESGALEQDADVILLLHRDAEKSPEFLNVGVPKNRHGRTGGLQLQWEGHYARVIHKRWSPAQALGDVA